VIGVFIGLLLIPGCTSETLERVVSVGALITLKGAFDGRGLDPLLTGAFDRKRTRGSGMLSDTYRLSL